MTLVKNNVLIGVMFGWLVAHLGGCSGKEKAVSVDLVIEESMVDLRRQLEGEWQQVCILGPYSNQHHAEEVLGFSYDVVANSHIYSSDSIALLVAVKDGMAVGAYEVNRTNVDFTQLNGQCFNREKAVFRVKQEGWPYAEGQD